MQETAKMSEESTTENQEIVSSVTSESTISTNVKEIPETAVTSSITGETPSMELDAEVTSEEVGIANPITAEEVSEIISATEETSTPMKSEKNTEVTSGISEITFDEALFSKSAPNSITEQPFVQANVDDVIRQVAQSKDILVTDTKPPISDVTVEEEAIGQVKGEGEGATQVDEDLSNIVDTLVSGSEHMTTEPPVQAVSDLISVLSQNSKVEEVIGRKDNENDAFIVNDMSVTKDGNDQATTDIVLSQLQEGFNKNSLQNIIKIKPSEGRTGECLGRIEFEILEADLSQLNVTNEIIVESPAACARKCYETANCILAAYKPSQNDESTTSAVCMLTSNAADCTPQEKFIPQHKSDLSPLIISCLKCTKCNYTIREETKLTRLHQAEIVEPALSIGQCSEICWKHSCTFAQYDHRSNLVSMLCSLTSVKGEEDCSKEKPVIVDGDEPVLLECVRCFT
uniref:Apple domain-containing protein n=1 Tax=Elaeophora elaphi TaxID=1147741 RepID=A0A0R3RFL7_9BILA